MNRPLTLSRRTVSNRTGAKCSDPRTSLSCPAVVAYLRKTGWLFQPPWIKAPRRPSQFGRGPEIRHLCFTYRTSMSERAAWRSTPRSSIPAAATSSDNLAPITPARLSAVRGSDQHESYQFPCPLLHQRCRQKLSRISCFTAARTSRSPKTAVFPQRISVRDIRKRTVSGRGSRRGPCSHNVASREHRVASQCRDGGSKGIYSPLVPLVRENRDPDVDENRQCMCFRNAGTSWHSDSSGQ